MNGVLDRRTRVPIISCRRRYLETSGAITGRRTWCFEGGQLKSISVLSDLLCSYVRENRLAYLYILNFDSGTTILLLNFGSQNHGRHGGNVIL